MRSTYYPGVCTKPGTYQASSTVYNIIYPGGGGGGGGQGVCRPTKIVLGGL